MSDDTGKQLEDRVKALAAGWTAALAAAVALLYLAGYLSLRFQLDALGVAADLNVVDERYLFEGAHFAVYLLTAVPSLLLLLGVAGAVVWLAGRLLPARTRAWRSAGSRNGTPAVVGIVWAVLAIQFVLRRAFELSDLLLGPLPCEPRWLVPLLYDTSGFLLPLYFAGLLALVVPPALCLRAAWPHRSEARWRFAVPLLAFLLAVELLLLPVNHGILTAGRGVPRLKGLAGEDESSKVWRLWQAEERSVFLVERPGPPAVRRLVVVPADDVGRQEILRHEAVLSVLASGRNPCGRR